MFLDPAACQGEDRIEAAIARAFAEHNRGQHGATTRIARFLVLQEPPSPEHGEVTAKGSLNQAMVLRRRADQVARLYAEGHVVGP